MIDLIWKGQGAEAVIPALYLLERKEVYDSRIAKGESFRISKVLLVELAVEHTFSPPSTPHSVGHRVTAHLLSTSVQYQSNSL